VAAKNQRQWMADPKLKAGEWVDSRIYSDPEIFEEELTKFSKRPGFRCVMSRKWRTLRFSHNIDRARAGDCLPRPRNEIRAFSTSARIAA